MATFNGYVKLDPAAVQRLLKGDNGPVVRDLFIAGEIVRQEAKTLVGVSQPDPVPRTRQRGAGGRFVAGSGKRKPGTLRDSIVKRLVNKGGTVAMQVGSDDPVALWHHEGTQPHTIVPVKAPRLVFYSAKAGKIVVAKIVHHPGTRPNRFLTNALRALRGRY